jgi:hypothetical protein
MRHVDRVIDVERHRARGLLVAVHPHIDERVAQPDRLVQARCILQATQGRLRTQTPIRVRQPAAGELERRITAQMIEIIAILVAARYGEDAGADHVGNAVHNARRIAPLGKHARQLLGHPDAPVARARSMTPPSDVRRPPSKAAVIFLRETAGNENGRIVSSVMASVASRGPRAGLVQQPNPTPSQRLTPRPLASPRTSVNKTG